MVSRSLLAVAAALALTAAGSGHARVRPRGPSSAPGRAGVVYAAHRGGALEVPENSLSGLVTAVRRHQAEVIDFDTRVLRDGTPVVMHDATLDRTTSSTGRVAALTPARWRGVLLRPDPALPGRWRPEPPPTVAEVLDRLGGQRTLTMEVKDPAGLPRLAEMVKARGLAGSVFVNTNRPALARRVHRLGLRAQLWRSAAQMRTDDFAAWRSFVELLDIDYQARDQDVRRAVRSGIPRVWGHTVNTPADRDRMLRLGCGGIITDAPGLLTRTPVRP
ncbi:glycerophosphodiester phosphodiesterase [Streptomyces palmae]|uniref:Glycerophosphodiester phosphodiesterase n=1 Tax=Streptomyces palmae TaxID=1701085 RepID=A0A4Z0FZR4_9ACTN|nr:glycerophosphodiester phosphodiesterase [Streptomyces palmae]TGA88448.1 glycerophosphodiester phosphodiesterase [Streptomyces palmae]